MSRPSLTPPPPQHQPHPQPPPPQPQATAPPPRQPLDVELTIISGKHLKNVNWRNNGTLKPYAIFWVDPDHKLTTKSDDSGSIKPVWNQRFLLPLPPSTPFPDVSLSIEIFHSKASETPKPFVGSLTIRLSELPELNNPALIRTFDLLRPSGRPQGKIKLKLAIKEPPFVPPAAAMDYHNVPPPSYYYSSAPPYPYNNNTSNSITNTSRSMSMSQPSSSTGLGLGLGYNPHYYMGGYYSPVAMPQAPPSRPVSNRYMGMGTGLAVGAVAGALGGMALDEGIKYEEERIADRVVDDNLAPRDDFSEYHPDY